MGYGVTFLKFLMEGAVREQSEVKQNDRFCDDHAELPDSVIKKTLLSM